MNGIDVSQFQGTINWQQLKADGVFVMIRANEGTPNSSTVPNVDANFVTNLTQARALGIPHGIYHFAYPQYNTAVTEANFFCNLIQNNGGLQKDEILVLDYEEVQNVSWAAVWLRTVSGIFGGYKPLIYMNLNFVQSQNWSEVISGGFGLWLAEYNGSKSFTAPQWPVVAMRQWTDAEKISGINGLVDGDVFNGGIAVFDKYGYQPPQNSASSTPKSNPVSATTQTTTTQTVSSPTPLEVADSTISKLQNELNLATKNIVTVKAQLTKANSAISILKTRNTTLSNALKNSTSPKIAPSSASRPSSPQKSTWWGFIKSIFGL
jgi:GH25 family lysozyme M1 (1,4-beta-N-acetylmuramidase)